MVPQEYLEEIFAQATRWKGCEWVTDFGPRRLNLEGLRSRQALLASKATRGEEAIAWKEAARWLGAVEDDATTACALASKAMRAVNTNQMDAAFEWFRAAESLENRYPLPRWYRLLRERFELVAGLQPPLSANGDEVERLLQGAASVARLR